jgi:hypothetical protein
VGGEAGKQKKKAKKRFFFEKKKQKTFIRLLCATGERPGSKGEKFLGLA